MATHRISILGGNTLPDSLGSVFFEPTSIGFANDRWPHGMWTYLPATGLQSIYGTFEVPVNFVSAPNFILVWTGSTITGSFALGVAYRNVSGTGGESFDQTGVSESGTVTINANTLITPFNRMEASISATAGSLRPYSTNQFQIFYSGNAPVGSYVTNIHLIDALLQYSD